MKTKSPTGWYLSVESYLLTAKLVSAEVRDSAIELINEKKLKNSIHLIPLIFSAIFNARHGVELFLKSLIVIQKDGIYPNDRTYKIHNLEDLYKFLNEGRDGLISISSITKDLPGLTSYFNSLQILVRKYQKYKFVHLPIFLNKEVFENIEDKMNMTFRFPEDESVSQAIRYLWDEYQNGGVDANWNIDNAQDKYIEKIRPHLDNIIKLSKEIEGDMDKMLGIISPIGNTVVAIIYNKNKTKTVN